MYENLTMSPCLALRLNSPLMLVDAPCPVLSTITETPIKGSPLVSVTIPLTGMVCAMTLTTGKSKSINNKLVTFDFIILIDWLVNCLRLVRISGYPGAVGACAGILGLDAKFLISIQCVGLESWIGIRGY